MPPEFDKDILATMTEDEVAAITDETPVPGERTAADAAAGSDDAGDDDDDQGGAADAVAAEPGLIEGKGAADKIEAKGAEADAVVDAAAVQQAPAKAAEPAKQEQPAAAAAEEPAAPPPPAFSFQPPADFEQRTTALKEGEAALWQRFEGGELSQAELQRELGKMAEERDALRAIQLKAELAADMQRQQAEHARDVAVAALFKRAGADGVNYREDKASARDLDTFLKALAADEANEDKPLQWFLDEAHKRVLVLRGKEPARQQKPATTPAQSVQAALAARKPDTSSAAVSLAHVPGGQGQGDVGGEFDDIMALDGEAFEDALDEMRRRQPQRWARFQQQAL